MDKSNPMISVHAEIASEVALRLGVERRIGLSSNEARVVSGVTQW